jgi:hypothetical protein
MLWRILGRHIWTFPFVVWAAILIVRLLVLAAVAVLRTMWV